MKSSPQDLEDLKKWIRNKDHSKIEECLRIFGPEVLNHSFEGYGDRELYPDLYSYYLLHLVIETEDLSSLELFKRYNASPEVSYTIQSNFNSRADQFMETESFNVVQWAKKCSAKLAVLNFLETWLLEYKLKKNNG